MTIGAAGKTSSDLISDKAAVLEGCTGTTESARNRKQNWMISTCRQSPPPHHKITNVMENHTNYQTQDNSTKLV